MKITYIVVLMIIASQHVFGQDEALIGEHTNATYFVKQFADIQSSLYDAIDNGYDIIRIAKGTYYMARSLQVSKHNIQIQGAVDTVLQLNNTRILGLAMFVFMGVSNVTIGDMTLDGYNNASQVSFEINGVALVNVTDGIMTSVSMRGFRNGVFINASTNINMLNNNVTSSQHDGFLVRNSTNVVLSNSSTCCNGRHGMNFFGNMTNVIISSNNAYSHMNDSTCAIRVEDADNVLLNNNTLSRNQIGLCLKSLAGVRVLNNVINSTTETKCIHINSITGSQFISNECNAKAIDPLVPPPASPPPPPPKASASPPPPPKKKQTSSSYLTTALSYVLVVLSGMLSVGCML